MITDNLKAQIKADEGVVYAIYNDHLGYATFGVGHLIKESDPEIHLEVGSIVIKAQANAHFRSMDFCLNIQMARHTAIIRHAIHSQSRIPDTSLRSGSKFRFIGKNNFTR